MAACDEPGASVAAVALAHELNANLVHKWRRRRDAKRLASATSVTPAQVAALSVPPAPLTAAPAAASTQRRAALTAQRRGVVPTMTDAAPAFVPVQLERSRAAAADIRLELRRGGATVIVTWPAPEAAACGSWLREWLG